MNDELHEAMKILAAIRQALDVPRNRFGTLQVDISKTEALRKLAVEYKVGGCKDSPEQIMKVIQAFEEKFYAHPT